MFQNIRIVIVFFLGTLLVQSQTDNNFWFKSIVSYSLNDKIKIDQEFQHRRQSDYDNSNLLDKNLMFNYRVWGQYKLDEDIRILISPYGYFSNYRMIEKQGDDKIESQKEIRFSVASEFQKEILNRLFLIKRFGMDYRVFESDHQKTLRLRNRFGIKYQLFNNVYFSLTDEVLFNVADYSNVISFDQNRIGINLEFKLSSIIKVDLGYMYLIRSLNSNRDYLQENNYSLNLSFQF